MTNARRWQMWEKYQDWTCCVASKRQWQMSFSTFGTNAVSKQRDEEDEEAYENEDEKGWLRTWTWTFFHRCHASGRVYCSHSWRQVGLYSSTSLSVWKSGLLPSLAILTILWRHYHSIAEHYNDRTRRRMSCWTRCLSRYKWEHVLTLTLHCKLANSTQLSTKGQQGQQQHPLSPTRCRPLYLLSRTHFAWTPCISLECNQNKLNELWIYLC